MTWLPEGFSVRVGDLAGGAQWVEVSGALPDGDSFVAGEALVLIEGAGSVVAWAFTRLAVQAWAAVGVAEACIELRAAFAVMSAEGDER